LFTNTGDGQLIVGGCASLIVTLKLQVAVFPAVSLALIVIAVVPIGKKAPLGQPSEINITAPTAQLSLAWAKEYVTAAPQTLASAFWTILFGQVIDGGSESTTETPVVHDAVLNDESSASHWSVQLPTGYTLVW